MGLPSAARRGAFVREWALWVLPPALYISLYVILDILIAHSGNTGGYQYDPVALIVVTEFIKLASSLMLWLGPELANGHCNVVDWTPSPTFLYYAFPAVMYTCWSVLNFQCLLRVSLATFSVLYQSVVFFTAVSWMIAFREHLSWQQWLALGLLCAGCLCAQLTPDLRFELDSNCPYVFVQSGLSAIASVMNEYLLKQKGREQVHRDANRNDAVPVRTIGINEQNTYMYIFSCLASVAWAIYRSPHAVIQPRVFFHGFDQPLVMSIACLAAGIGMLVTVILKHTNVIVKVYAQAFHAPLEIVLAHYTIGTRLGYMAIVSSLVITASSVWYAAERERIKQGQKSKDSSHNSTHV